MKQAELGAVAVKGREQLKRLVQLRTLRQLENSYIRRVVALCEGDLTLAAKVLDIGRATLYRRVAEFRRVDTAKKITTRGQRERDERTARARAIREEFATRGPRL